MDEKELSQLIVYLEDAINQNRQKGYAADSDKKRAYYQGKMNAFEEALFAIQFPDQIPQS